jgi:hypothetical protein
MLRRRQLLTAATLAGSLPLPPDAAAQRALLTVRWNPDKKVIGEVSYRFSEEEFMALRSSAIVTSTPWTRRARFDGPLLSDVLRHVGAGGSQLNVESLDDYSCSIPLSDLATYGVILAHSRDGKRMTARDYGPLWIIYPRDAYPDALSNVLAYAKSVWQVWRITVVS